MNYEFLLETFHNRLCIFHSSVKRSSMKLDKCDDKERDNKRDSIYG